jgi:hypothetical protein
MISTSTQHRALFNRLQNAEDAAAAFKVGGIDALAAMDKVRAQDEDSGGSAVSDLSALDNEPTDEFGKRILQHARDKKRIDNAIRSGQPFRKTRPRPRLSAGFGAQEGQDGLRTEPDHQRTGSAGSSGSDPPLNVPSQWGRRARRKPEWLRTFQSPENEAKEAEKTDEDAIIPHRTAYTGDDDWERVGHEPLPSIETTPPSMRRIRADTTPTSLRHMNTTLQDALGSDDQDFNGASLLASTPAAVNRRNRRIDELTRLEIETMERRQITTRTHQVFDRPKSDAPEERPLTAPSEDSEPLPRRRRSLFANKENVKPNGDVNAGLKKADTPGLVNRTAQAVTFKNPQRPSLHNRNDSIDLLRNLARVSSLSPSPARRSTEVATAEKRAMETDKAAQRQLYPTPEADQQEVKGKEGGQKQAPAEQPAPAVEVTPARQQPADEAKTPVVTGASNGTPAATFDVRPLLKSTDLAIVRAFGSPSGEAALEPSGNPVEDHIRRIHSEPVHAKSALADVLKDLKAQPNAQYGETTIQSLEDIVNPNLDPTDPTLTAEIEQAREALLDEEAIDDGQPLTQAEKDRRQEALALEALNKSLRRTRTSIKDADRGLRRVENRIETAQPATTAPIEGKAIIIHHQSSETPHLPTIGKHDRIVCSHCGGTFYGSVWHALWVEFRENFYTFDDETKWTTIRLTWLGLICLSFWVWLITEYTLCEIYCHPRYAATMKGYGVNPDAPEFPLVLPTLVFKPLKPIWRPAGAFILWAAGVVGNLWFGEEVAESRPKMKRPVYGGQVRQQITRTFTDSKFVETATAAAASVARSAVDTLDEAESIWDDELWEA